AGPGVAAGRLRPLPGPVQAVRGLPAGDGGRGRHQRPGPRLPPAAAADPRESPLRFVRPPAPGPGVVRPRDFDATAMQEKINVRFLLWSLAAVGLLGGGYFAAHAYQVRRTAGALLEQATRAEEHGRPDRATLLVSRYLLLRPDDTEAQARHGSLL